MDVGAGGIQSGDMATWFSGVVSVLALVVSLIAHWRISRKQHSDSKVEKLQALLTFLRNDYNRILEAAKNHHDLLMSAEGSQLVNTKAPENTDDNWRDFEKYLQILHLAGLQNLNAYTAAKASLIDAIITWNLKVTAHHFSRRKLQFSSAKDSLYNEIEQLLVKEAGRPFSPKSFKRWRLKVTLVDTSKSPHITPPNLF